MDKTQSGQPRKWVSTILTDMAENSSLHGIPKIVTSRHFFVKILWLLLFIATTGYMVKQLYTLFDNYYSWPVKTKVSLNFSTLKFPAVTFCNMNPIRRSQLKKTPTNIQNILNPRKKVKVEERKKRELAGSYDSFSVALTPTPSLISTITEATTAPISISPDQILISSSLNVFATDIISSPVELSNTNTAWQTNEESDHVSLTTEPLETYPESMTSEDYSDYSLFSVMEYMYPSYPSTDYGLLSTGDYSYDYMSQDFWDYWWDTAYDSGSSDLYFDASDYWASQYGEYEDYLEDLYDYQDDTPKDKWQERVDKFKEAFSQSSREQRLEWGHVIEDMLLSCSFAGRVCGKEDFKHFMSDDFGNCYTIENLHFSSRISGPNHGLAFTLNIGAREYVTNFATGYGIRLVIHEPGTYPFPFEEGLTVSTGYETSIGLRMIKIKRMNAPYGDCEDGEEFKRKFKIDYSMPACIQLCKQEQIEDICKCEMTESMDLNQTATATNDTIVFCDQSKNGACMKVINLKYAKGDLNCTCRAPCKEILYEKTLSGRTWPNRDYLSMALIKDVCRQNLSYFHKDCAEYKNDKENINTNWWSENFLKVIIYYEDLNYETIEEEPLYDTARFVSDIGGTLGLFMGASLLSAFEVLQLLVELGMLFYRSMKQGQSTQKVNAEKSEHIDRGLTDVNIVSSKMVPDNYNNMYRPNYGN